MLREISLQFCAKHNTYTDIILYAIDTFIAWILKRYRTNNNINFGHYTYTHSYFETRAVIEEGFV